MRNSIVACTLALVLGCADQQESEYSTAFGNAVELLNEHKSLEADVDTLERLLDANRTIEKLVKESKEREERDEFTAEELELLAEVKEEIQQTQESIETRLPLLMATKSALGDAVESMSEIDKTLYIETSIISYATACPSRDITIAGLQQQARDWWTTERQKFELVTSQLTLDEAGNGDPTAAVERLKLLDGLRLIDINPDVESLAKRLIEAHTMPE